jgi:hypothetical protein
MKSIATLSLTIVALGLPLIACGGSPVAGPTAESTGNTASALGVQSGVPCPGGTVHLHRQGTPMTGPLTLVPVYWGQG